MCPTDTVHHLVRARSNARANANLAVNHIQLLSVQRCHFHLKAISNAILNAPNGRARTKMRSTRRADPKFRPLSPSNVSIQMCRSHFPIILSIISVDQNGSHCHSIQSANPARHIHRRLDEYSTPFESHKLLYASQIFDQFSVRIHCGHIKSTEPQAICRNPHIPECAKSP